jgi:hypothetical protein
MDHWNDIQVTAISLQALSYTGQAISRRAALIQRLNGSQKHNYSPDVDEKIIEAGCEIVNILSRPEAALHIGPIHRALKSDTQHMVHLVQERLQEWQASQAQERKVANG